jgi:hypothetical protein
MDDEVRFGRYARLELPSTAGSIRVVTVGFVDGEDDSVFVAAGTSEARWAVALANDHDVVVTIGDRRFRATAVVVDEGDPERARALRELVLRYGTPSEKLGRGPVFRLSPLRG